MNSKGREGLRYKEILVHVAPYSVIQGSQWPKNIHRNESVHVLLWTIHIFNKYDISLYKMQVKEISYSFIFCVS